MNPLYISIMMLILSELPISLSLEEIADENLKAFIINNELLDYFWENNLVSKTDGKLVLKNVKQKNLESYWDEVKKFIDINGQTVDEWNKQTKGRWLCYVNNLMQIEKLIKKGYTTKNIADTLSYVATRDGQYTSKLTVQLEPILFKQNFEAKDENSTIVRGWNT